MAGSQRKRKTPTSVDALRHRPETPVADEGLLAEIRSLIESRAGSTYLAEGYTGWPA